MSKQSIIAGTRFGYLVAVEPTEERKNGYTVWRCLCDCGNVTLCASRELKNGWSRSCEDPSCRYNRELKKMRARYDDLTGQRFGMLTVQSKAGKDEKGRICWNCVCDCGGTVVAPTGQLKAGYRKSCGCLSHPPLKDWVGRRFGKLTVLGYDGKREGKHWWKCRCDCGNEAVICQSSLKIGHTTSCGCANKPYECKTFIEGTCIDALRSAVRTRTVASNNRSGVRGVYKSRKSGRWCAQITFKGKTKYLGSYETLMEARIARERGEEIFEDFLEKYDPQETASAAIASGAC